MSICSRYVNPLFICNQLLRTSGISRLSSIGSALCREAANLYPVRASSGHLIQHCFPMTRMAGFERRQVCCKRNLALLIALCLVFSFVPVTGCELVPEDYEGSANQNLISPSGSLPIPSHPLTGQISSERYVVARVMAQKALGDMSSSVTGNGHFQPDPQVLLRFPDEISEVDCRIKQIRGTGIARVSSRAGIAGTGASQKQALFASTKLLEQDYHKERLKNAPTPGQTRVSNGYIKVKRFQLIEEVEGETHIKKRQNMVSHGLIRARPLELMEAVEEESNSQNQQTIRESEATSGMAALRRRTGRFWEKAEENKASEHRLPNLLSSHLGLGETIEQEQIRNVVAALRRAGLFAAIAGTIEGLNLLMLPQLATIFVPTDSAYQNVKQADRNLQLFQYHIVIPRFTFPQLCSLREGDILYTLLPGCIITVTGRQNPFKLTLDDVTLIAPNLYLDETIAVHGVDGIFNSSIYGKSPANRHFPRVTPSPAEAPANVADKQPLLSSPPAQEPGLSSNNGSAAGALQQGQLSPSAQQNADARHNSTTSTTNDANSFPFSISPLASEFASDIDASDDPFSAKFGACVAATAIVCVMSILC